MRGKSFRRAVAKELAKHGVAPTIDKGRIAVDIVISEIIRATLEEGRVEIRGFGVFTKRTISGREVFNLRSTEPHDVSPRWRIAFKSGKHCRGVQK